MCVYSKEKKNVTLYKTNEYYSDRKFHCEIRSSGKNSSKLVAHEFVSQQLAPYKREDGYAVGDEHFVNASKARNKDECSSRIKFKEILPFCFFIDGKKIKKQNRELIFKIDNIKQLIPTIALYIE